MCMHKSRAKLTNCLYARPCSHKNQSCAGWNFEEQNFTLLTLLDLSKAFDSVSQEILLFKLVSLGVRDAWFESYLSSRRQPGRIGRVNSVPRSVNCGGPSRGPSWDPCCSVSM